LRALKSCDNATVATVFQCFERGAEYSRLLDEYDCGSACRVTYNVNSHFTVQAMK